VAITSSDFFTAGAGGDWLEPVEPEELDRDRLTRLLEAADPVEPDIDVALALMDLVRDDLTASGTGGGESLSDQDMRLATRVLSRVAERAGYEFKLPFRDHTSWRAWWNRNDGYGSWQARRELLGDLFDETYARLIAAQDQALDATLVEAISPHRTLGWPEVDTEINELRRQFSRATTPQDCAAVGLVAVRVTEALSRKVYVHAVHGAPGEEEPKISARRSGSAHTSAQSCPARGTKNCDGLRRRRSRLLRL